MRKLSVFNSVSLDGFFTDRNHDVTWAHRNNNDEWGEFVAQNASGEGMLLFGRITYEMMAGYWTTPMAMQDEPVVAKGINAMPKVVFSRTLDKATWNNTKLVKGDLITEVRTMKSESGPDMVILGSGSIVAQLTEAKLIDEYQFALNPVVLGEGRTMFEGVPEEVWLNLTRTRSFSNGNVFLCYEPRH